MPKERSVRDRLAEALWLNEGPRLRPWRELGAVIWEAWHAEADELLAALRSVGLQLVPLSPHQAGDSER